MDNFYSELIGIVAGCCTTFAFLPQVIKVIKSRSAKDISLPMYVIFNTGLVLWATYGVIIQSPSLIIANGLTLILACSILVMKLIWG
jgi:MtN3 and saliva related transmembrane protein